MSFVLHQAVFYAPYFYYITINIHSNSMRVILLLDPSLRQGNSDRKIKSVAEIHIASKPEQDFKPDSLAFEPILLTAMHYLFPTSVQISVAELHGVNCMNTVVGLEIKEGMF